MLKTLCEINATSGDEENIRKIIYEYASENCTEIATDCMGNLICYKKGTGALKSKIMISAHMDEVGFIIKGVTDEGYLIFGDVGGIDKRILQSQKVIIGENKIKGVIGCIPVHFSKKGQKSDKELLIDIGAFNKADALKYINIGDYAYFDSNFVEFGDGMIKAKALDDRVGCYIMLNLLKESFANDIYFAFLVQEEVGCRGAMIAANMINPDYSLVLEGTTCSDVPFSNKYDYSTILNNGVALSRLDGSSYSNIEITNYLTYIADKYDIPYQYKTTLSGGNDVFSIQTSLSGIKCSGVSTPVRYIHSPSSVASKKDINSCLELLLKSLKEENAIWSY